MLRKFPVIDLSVDSDSNYRYFDISVCFWLSFLDRTSYTDHFKLFKSHGHHGYMINERLRQMHELNALAIYPFSYSVDREIKNLADISLAYPELFVRMFEWCIHQDASPAHMIELLVWQYYKLKDNLDHVEITSDDDEDDLCDCNHCCEEGVYDYHVSREINDFRPFNTWKTFGGNESLGRVQMLDFDKVVVPYKRFVDADMGFPPFFNKVLWESVYCGITNLGVCNLTCNFSEAAAPVAAWSTVNGRPAFRNGLMMPKEVLVSDEMFGVRNQRSKFKPRAQFGKYSLLTWFILIIGIFDCLQPVTANELYGSVDSALDYLHSVENSIKFGIFALAFISTFIVGGAIICCRTARWSRDSVREVVRVVTPMVELTPVSLQNEVVHSVTPLIEVKNVQLPVEEPVVSKFNWRHVFTAIGGAFTLTSLVAIVTRLIDLYSVKDVRVEESFRNEAYSLLDRLCCVVLPFYLKDKSLKLATRKWYDLSGQILMFVSAFSGATLLFGDIKSFTHWFQANVTSRVLNYLRQRYQYDEAEDSDDDDQPSWTEKVHLPIKMQDIIVDYKQKIKSWIGYDKIVVSHNTDGAGLGFVPVNPPPSQTWLDRLYDCNPFYFIISAIIIVSGVCYYFSSKLDAPAVDLTAAHDKQYEGRKRDLGKKAFRGMGNNYDKPNKNEDMRDELLDAGDEMYMSKKDRKFRNQVEYEDVMDLDVEVEPEREFTSSLKGYKKPNYPAPIPDRKAFGNYGMNYLLENNTYSQSTINRILHNLFVLSQVATDSTVYNRKLFDYASLVLTKDKSKFNDTLNLPQSVFDQLDFATEKELESAAKQTLEKDVVELKDRLSLLSKQYDELSSKYFKTSEKFDSLCKTLNNSPTLYGLKPQEVAPVNAGGDMVKPKVRGMSTAQFETWARSQQCLFGAKCTKSGCIRIHPVKNTRKMESVVPHNLPINVSSADKSVVYITREHETESILDGVVFDNCIVTMHHGFQHEDVDTIFNFVTYDGLRQPFTLKDLKVFDYGVEGMLVYKLSDSLMKSMGLKNATITKFSSGDQVALVTISEKGLISGATTATLENDGKLISYAMSTHPGACCSPIISRERNGVVGLHLYGGPGVIPQGVLITSAFHTLITSAKSTVADYRFAKKSPQGPKLSLKETTVSKN